MHFVVDLGAEKHPMVWWLRGLENDQLGGSSVG